MRKIKEIAVVSGLTVVAALGLAACGGSTAANTPVAATVAPTVAATAMMEQPTTAPTAMMEQPTTAPTAMMEQPTSAPTAMMEQPTAMATAMMTTEATAMSQPTTGTGGGTTLSGPGADLLTKYVQAFKEIKSYHIVQQISAAGQNITQEGDFQAPDRTRLTTDMGAAGKLNTIIIGTKVYQQVPGGDSYTVSDSGSSALTDLRDTSMLQYVESADIVGDETVNGVAATHLKYVVDGDKMMAQLSQGTPTTTGTNVGKLTIEVWIDKSNNYPVQQKLDITVGSGGTSTQTSTTQTYSKYNETVSPAIEAPANVTQMPGVPTP